ncbi:MAG: glycosyltransferase [Saprospiraceae bacterium]|nr:glycosyltransferase [Saprospiraceae bacterium]
MTIIFTLTNDLSYDQRMHRICGTLASKGHVVTLVGLGLPHSTPLETRPFAQKRLSCFFQKGFLFYAEYNLRLFFYLLVARYDAVCSIDLDTLAAGCFASLIRRKKRVFDAHEYFTEVPEVVHRPFVKLVWGLVARICLPFYRHAYTVGPDLARIFEEKYGLQFGVVRNVPAMNAAVLAIPESNSQIRRILYQGALNEGRGIEAMLEAMQHLENVQLVLAGEGDISSKLRQRAIELRLDDRVVFLGYLKPEDLKSLTAQAWLGLNLLENRGLSYYYSLANKFFDCVHAGVPVLTMNFPEYRVLNAQHEVAILLEELNPTEVSSAIRSLLEDETLYEKLRHNCLLARDEWNWEREQKTLLEIWQKVEFK